MSGKYRVVITDFVNDDLRLERNVLGELAEIEALEATSEEELMGRVEAADALMVYHYLSVGRTTIERLERCKVIVRGGVGYDNIDRAFARERDIPVCNVPDYGTEDVADAAMGHLLSLARGIVFYNSRLREGQGEWAYTEGAPLLRLRGRVLGIVGLGRIGSAMALRGKAIGMDVAFYDPYKQDGYDKGLGIRRVESLEELLAQAFAVSLHTPLTEETHNMIDAAAIARMPVGSYLINTSRGAVLDTSAVPDAIASGRLAGAGIDVLPVEPPADDDPLIAAWRDPGHPAHHRVLVTPHTAFYSEQGLEDMRIKVAEGVRRALRGEPLRNVVN
jgi:D-3-phosphoglycerate dehydrogenase/C-terminal binding protein